MDGYYVDGREPMTGMGPVIVPPPPWGINKGAPSGPRPSTAAAEEGGGGGSVVRSVVRKWRREDLLDKAGLVLRSLALLLSLIALVLVASNKHDDWMNFNLYQEYRYLLSVTVIAFVYSLAQLARLGHRFNLGIDLVSPRYASIVNFIGDQVLAYLYISALSSTIPITNRMREVVTNTFTDASAAAIAIGFFAFLVFAISAIISGFKLAKQSYI